MVVGVCCVSIWPTRLGRYLGARDRTKVSPGERCAAGLSLVDWVWSAIGRCMIRYGSRNNWPSWNVNKAQVWGQDADGWTVYFWKGKRKVHYKPGLFSSVEAAVSGLGYFILLVLGTRYSVLGCLLRHNPPSTMQQLKPQMNAQPSLAASCLLLIFLLHTGPRK